MKTVFSSYVYANPLPQLRAVNSAFPFFCQRADGAILASHQMGQAFESVDGTSFVSLSADGGERWSAPRRMFDKSGEAIPLTDCAKLTALADGRVVALGYQFYREDPDLPIGNPLTGGLLRDEVYFSISEDGGESFGPRTPIADSWNGHAEASAPLCLLADGSWATPITGFPSWDGARTGRNCGRLLRSYDQGKSWNDDVVCMAFPGDGVLCYEQRLCQLTNGALVVIGWNEDIATGKRLNNHVTISRDNGLTFSAPIDTGIAGQASSVLALDDNRLLSLHAVRRDTDAPGIYACVADLTDGLWRIDNLQRVWTPNAPIARDKNMAEIFSFLKFGQPGAIRLRDGGILMSHWVCEEGVYKTCATRIEL